MTKALTTRRVLPLLFSLVSAILLFLLLAPTASAKTYTISGTGTKTKTITVPKGYYQATLTWSNNGKEMIMLDIVDTKKNATSYANIYLAGKKDTSLSSFYSPKKQKYNFSVTAAEKGEWKITLKPLKITKKLTFSGKNEKIAYIKIPKGTYKLSYTYSNNKPKGKSIFTAKFIEESIHTKMLKYNSDPDNFDFEESKTMFSKYMESTVVGSKVSGKGSITIVVEKSSRYLVDIGSEIFNSKTGAVKPNHNVKWSFKLTQR